MKVANSLSQCGSFFLNGLNISKNKLENWYKEASLISIFPKEFGTEYHDRFRSFSHLSSLRTNIYRILISMKMS